MPATLTTSRFRFPSDHQKIWQRYGVAILSVLSVVGIRYVLGIRLPALNAPFLLLFPGVLFATWYGGFGPGVLATVIAVTSADYLFIPPLYQFTKPAGPQWIQLSFFVGVNLLMAYLVDNLRGALIANNQSGRELLESQNKIFNILQSIQGCFFSVDRNGNFIHINEDCHDYLKDVASFLGKNVWEAFPNWKDTEFGSKFAEAVAQRHSAEFEFHDSKESRWHEVHISPSSEGLSVHIFDVTSRKKAEARLNRLVASDIIGVFFGTFSVRKITQANEVFLKMIGYSQKDLLAGRLNEAELTPEEYRELDREKWEECRHIGSCDPWEKEYIRPDGVRVPVLLRATILDETAQEWGCFVVDLTERKTRERRQITEYAITQILTVDPSLSIAMPKILQTICEGLGWELGIFWESRPETGILRFSESWTAEYDKYAGFIQISSELKFPFGQPLPGEIWKSRAPRWVYDIGLGTDLLRQESCLLQGFKSAFGFPVRLGEEILGVLEFFSFKVQQPDQGLLDMAVAIGGEIGQFVERKQTEEDLRLSQQHFNLALEAARMGYWSWDLKTDKIEWSKNVHFFHGCDEKVFEGTFEAFLRSVHPEDRDWVGRKLLEAVQSRSEYHLEFRVLWPDQSVHWIDARGQVFYDEDGDALRMIGLLIDITERKRSEENLRLVNEELERRVESRTFELARTNLELKNEISERQKVEKEALEIVQKEQRRFSSQLHDGLCQNLTGIMMMAKALTRKLEKKSVGEATDLSTIAELVNRSITDARDMARGLFPVELEANSLMFSLHGLSLRIESLFQVSCRFHCPKPILLKDNIAATHLFRIAQEAVQNAISHGNAKNIQIGLARADGKIVLEVRDDGEGLSEDLKVSTGIGVQIMKYRARMLDASLDFAKLNRGTLFTCTVPIHEELFIEKEEPCRLESSP